MAILRWMSALRRRRRRPTRDLPDDVMVEILSRLPVKYVVRCRAVCRRWKALTSTPDFLELQHKRGAPTLVAAHRGACREKQVSLITDDWEKTTSARHRTQITVNFVRPSSTSDVQDLVFSCNGLIVFREEFQKLSSSSRHHVLINPATKEKVRLITPGGLIYGIYLHPLLKKYCVLWGDLDSSGKHMNYKILVLKTSCGWRDLQVTNVSYQPRSEIPPVTVDDFLYWMIGDRYPSSNNGTRRSGTSSSCSECIMAFDTKREIFGAMTHPASLQQQYSCTDDSKHERMHLAGVDGLLCLCERSLYEDLMNIWILREDDKSSSRIWIRRYKITIGMDAGLPYRMTAYKVRPLPIMNGILFLEWQERGLFTLNFKRNTLQKIGLTTSTNRAVLREALLSEIRVHTHVPSLVRIGHCPSEIGMLT